MSAVSKIKEFVSPDTVKGRATLVGLDAALVALLWRDHFSVLALAMAAVGAYNAKQGYNIWRARKA